MPVGAVIGGALGAAGSIGSALIGSNASKNAANAQAQAQQAALAQQQKMFDTGLNGVQPFVDYGKTAGSTLTSLLTPGPNQTALLSQLPGFQFAQDWGQKAVANLGSTTGLGGNVLKAGADYATGAAQQGFMGLAGLLQNLTNTGASAAGSVFGNATQTGANMGNTLGNIGNAQASGILGSANAISGGLTGTGNALTNAFLFNKLLGNNAAGGGGPSGIYSVAEGTNG